MTATYDRSFELRFHQALNLKQRALKAKQSNDYTQAYVLKRQIIDDERCRRS